MINKNILMIIIAAIFLLTPISISSIIHCRCEGCCEGCPGDCTSFGAPFPIYYYGPSGQFDNSGPAQNIVRVFSWIGLSIDMIVLAITLLTVNWYYKRVKKINS